MSYLWHTSNDKVDEGVNILKEGIKANPARLVMRPTQIFFLTHASFEQLYFKLRLC